MLLTEWTDELFDHGVELFNDKIVTTNDKGVAITRNTRQLRQVCLGVISCNVSKEFYNVCRLHAPIGTIITDYEENYWNTKYEDVLTLCRIALTKALLDERSSKSAKILLDILTKRDKEHWSDSKTVDIKGNGENSQPISISIVGV